MNTVERKYEYTLKQYRRDGFGRSYYFIDVYLNTRLENSIMIRELLSDVELARLLDVTIARLTKGENIAFATSDEKRMNQLFLDSKYNLDALERTLERKMGRERFDTHYEKKCYYLAFVPENAGHEVHETFWADRISTLMSLKLAHQYGETIGRPYRILLSDKETEVDPELLAFALSEN